MGWTVIHDKYLRNKTPGSIRLRYGRLTELSARTKELVRFHNKESEEELEHGSRTYRPRNLRIERLSIEGDEIQEVPYSHPAHPARRWTAVDEETLLKARSDGMDWDAIREKHLPHKSTESIHIKHSRLLETRKGTGKQNVEGPKGASYSSDDDETIVRARTRREQKSMKSFVKYSADEDATIVRARREGMTWPYIHQTFFPTRSEDSLSSRYSAALRGRESEVLAGSKVKQLPNAQTRRSVIQAGTADMSRASMQEAFDPEETLHASQEEEPSSNEEEDTISSTKWTDAEDKSLLEARREGKLWSAIHQEFFPHRTRNACTSRYRRLTTKESKYKTMSPLSSDEEQEYQEEQGTPISKTWLPTDNETLVKARRDGMTWDAIQQKNFPRKTPGACA